MKILGLDSSGLVASVALIDDNNLLGEYTVNYKKTHSQTLLPMVDTLLGMLEMKPEDIDAIAISAGPGSFTGLRIGSATAKGLGLALKKPLIEVSTLEALAYQLFGVKDIICPLMDARRSQVYTALYHFEEEILVKDMQESALSIYDIIEEINKRGRTVAFLGDGLSVYENIIREHVKVPYMFAPAFSNKQRAGALAGLGLVLYKEGKFCHAREHQPNYLRLSQAERERMEKEGGMQK